MVGLTPRATLDQGIEAALRRDRWIVIGSLVLLVALAWLYLWLDARAMSGMPTVAAADPSGAFAGGESDAGVLLMLLVMWAVMMVGMMLPSAAPAILLYAGLARKSGERGTALPSAWIFSAGYLLAWLAFSAVVAPLQLGLQRAALITPRMVSASDALSAGILIAAGAYQLLPLKDACLRRCRSPLTFLLTRWRPGRAGALRMGLEHGAFCVGCCWALMLLLLVAGVMDLLWVALIAGLVLIEKALPFGVASARLAGVALLAAGALVALS